jgi:hypothetical protein
MAYQSFIAASGLRRRGSSGLPAEASVGGRAPGRRV